MHRDIKPGNFLFNPKTRRGYLTDFGLAQVIGDTNRRAKNPEFQDLMDLQNSLKVHHRNGTRGYLSPQCLFKRPNQSTGVDVWAAGVVMLQLFTKRHQVFFVRDLESEVESFLLQNLIPLISLFGSHEVSRFAFKCGWALKVPQKFPVRQIDWRTIIPKSIPDDGIQILDLLLKMHDGLRIKASQALRHKFFDDVRDAVDAMIQEQIQAKKQLEAEIYD